MWNQRLPARFSEMVLVAGRAWLLGRAEVVLGLSCQQGCSGLIHEIVEVGRDLWRSPSQGDAQQGHPEHVTQDGIQEGLNISGAGDSTTSLCSLSLCSVTSL